MVPVTVRRAVDLGHAHYAAGRLAEAEAAYRRVLQAAPDHPEALHALGLILSRRGELEAAIDFMSRSVAARPDNAAFHTNLGLALAAAGRFADAAAVQRRAIALQGDPPTVRAYGNLGNSLLRLERMAEAIDCYRKELALHPDNADAWSHLGLALSETGRVAEGLDCYRRAVARDPRDAQLHSNLLFLAHFDPATDATALREEHRAWAVRHAAPLAADIRPHANDRSPDRRLRIGYVSPDLYTHVVGWSILPILANHDQGRFEVVCYSDHPRPDGLTRRLRSQVDLWRDTARVDDAALAEQIRHDRVDVLVDLALHMRENRMLTFARRPAPLQVTYLGYAASTGLPQMDYRITDVHMDPPGEPSDGPEELLRLPRCYWAYRPADAALALDVGPPPAARNGFVTFGSFNNFRKVNPAVIAAWAAILRQVPDARLLVVLRGGTESNPHVPALFAGHGIDPARVHLLPRQTPGGYFRLHNEVDLTLDPFPYNGGVTSLNSLWMGVPFVTLAGRRAVARAGLSILTNLQLPELIAQDVEEYVRLTAQLARDPARLAGLRGSLRNRLRQSPLMDEKRLTLDLEGLLLHAWERWRAPAA
jgi:predicted O-linked N-acetylglucosamine transferase (SPINDLY family)